MQPISFRVDEINSLCPMCCMLCGKDIVRAKGTSAKELSLYQKMFSEKEIA